MKMLHAGVERVESLHLFFAFLFALVFVAFNLLRSATKMMWYDELCTYYPALLPNLSDLVSFFTEGHDANTPLASLVTRATIEIFGSSHLTLRLPFTLGFLVMCLAIYRFAVRWVPPVYALAAMVFPAITSAAYYAVELRAYGLVLGFAGAALIAWQEATAEAARRRSLWLVLLGVSLMLMVACHFFAVFVLIPFGLAELVRWRRQGRPDWGVWACLFLALVPLVVFLPGLQASRRHYLRVAWALADPSLAGGAYREMLTLSYAPLCGAMVASLLLAALRRRGPANRQDQSPIPAEVWTLVFALALLPFLSMPVWMLAGTFLPRYALAFIAGIALALAFVTARATRGDRLTGGIALLFFCGWFLMKSASTVRMQMAAEGGLTRPAGAPLAGEPWMREIQARRELPVAVVPSVFFLKTRHYAPPAAASRMVYVSSAGRALQIDGSAIGEVNMRLFGQQMAQFHHQDYAAFTARHRHFLLLAETEFPHWLIPALQRDGARIGYLTRRDTVLLLEVHLD
jgi:hypothetical protein